MMNLSEKETTRIMEPCPDYAGVSCVDGSCPAIDRPGHLRDYCVECWLYKGCVDCWFDGRCERQKAGGNHEQI